MPALMADADIEGQFKLLIQLIASGTLAEAWLELNVRIESFKSLGLLTSTSDAVVWRRAQASGIVLVTGNRNKDGQESLEQTIRSENTLDSMPVITIGAVDRILSDREYASRAAHRLFGYIADLDTYRGTGRLYIP
jgi:hypothetical protein